MVRWKKGRINISALFTMAIIILIVAIVVSVSNGSVKYNVEELIIGLFTNDNPKASTILKLTRLPRVLVAVLVGANMAMAGANMQAVMKNPLADPGIIGVSAGAALAAIFIMLVFPGYTFFVPILAFAGGMAASIIVLAMAWKDGANPIRIILSGIAVNAILGGGVSLLSILYGDRIQGVLLWSSGSMSGVSLKDFQNLAFFSFIGLAATLISIPFSNAIILGDDTAKTLGVNINFARIFLCATSAYLTGISVATVGIIGFVGLIIPHISRILVGSDYKKLIPFSFITGASLLVGADCIARTAFSPIEIPVGIIMSILGGPFFIYLLRKKRRF